MSNRCLLLPALMLEVLGLEIQPEWRVQVWEKDYLVKTYQWSLGQWWRQGSVTYRGQDIQAWEKNYLVKTYQWSLGQWWRQGSVKYRGQEIQAWEKDYLVNTYLRGAQVCGRVLLNVGGEGSLKNRGIVLGEDLLRQDL